ncbi:hypothetical protein CSKR_100995 [Clonorchis sinensis]|uniref:Uncharacterized protein n=1 Tax=Clonorchis sinensis TaxID=79923 RepID=A0A419Q490_CLOSI|nr:hypothetical protein CSKR_100995 [Clonorchis sinensis]
MSFDGSTHPVFKVWIISKTHSSPHVPTCSARSAFMSILGASDRPSVLSATASSPAVSGKVGRVASACEAILTAYEVESGNPGRF